MTIERLRVILEDHVLKLIRRGSKNVLYCSNSIDIIPNYLPKGVTTLDELASKEYVWAYVINENRYMKLDPKQIGADFFKLDLGWTKMRHKQLGNIDASFIKLDLDKFIIRDENIFKVLRSNLDTLNQDCVQCKKQILVNNGVSIPDNYEAAKVLEKILLGVRDKDTRRYLGNRETYRNYEEIVTSCEQQTGLDYQQLLELVTTDTFPYIQRRYDNPLNGWTEEYRNYLYDCFRYHGGIYKILEETYHRPLNEMIEVYANKIGFKVR